MIKIFIASDHAGIELKSKLVKKLMDNHFIPDLHREVTDLGPQNTDSVDYADFASLVAQKIHGLTLIDSEKRAPIPLELGILICGSGQGMAMRANKYPQIRAALVWDKESTRLSREHNDANILCLGARLLDHDLCVELVQIFLTTHFAGGRHLPRVAKISTPVE